MVQVAEQIDELGVRVAVVSFAAPERLAAHARDLGLPFDYLSDGRRAAYAAFGFGRASAARVYLDPRVWATYAGLVARGRRLRPPEDDTLQLGGDVLAEAGRVRWIHRSDGPEDRPSVAELRAALGTN